MTAQQPAGTDAGRRAFGHPCPQCRQSDWSYLLGIEDTNILVLQCPADRRRFTISTGFGVGGSPADIRETPAWPESTALKILRQVAPWLVERLTHLASPAGSN